MKHTLSIALLLLAGCDAYNGPAVIPEPEEPEVPETYVEIPDETLKNDIIQWHDTDQDGKISTTEAEKAEYLSIPDGVKDLTGIEAFKNITALYIEKVAISELKVDGSLFPKLTKLTIETNTIERFELGNALALQEFQYTDKDPDPGSYPYMPGLRQLSIYNCSALESIEYNPLIDYNTLADLQIAGCPRIESLRLYRTALHTLPHTGLPNLKQYTLYGGPSMESIDLSRNSELTEFSCGKTGLTALDLSHCPKLQRLDCSEPVQELDLSPCPQLTWIRCYQTELSQLDISKNPVLVYFYSISNSKLEKVIMTRKQELYFKYFHKDDHTNIIYID